MASNELTKAYLELADGSFIEVVDPYGSPDTVRVDFSLKRHRECISFLASANKNYTLHRPELHKAIDHSLRAEVGGLDAAKITAQYYSETVYGEAYVGTVTNFAAVLAVFGWDK